MRLAFPAGLDRDPVGVRAASSSVCRPGDPRRNIRDSRVIGRLLKFMRDSSIPHPISPRHAALTRTDCDVRFELIEFATG